MFFSVNGILFSPIVKLSDIIFIIGLFDTISFDFISTNYSLFCLPYFVLILLVMIRAKINIFNILNKYIAGNDAINTLNKTFGNILLYVLSNSEEYLILSLL